MEAAEALAQAIAALLAVIDFEAIIIDGAFPAEVRRRLVERTNEHFAHMDRQGLTETVVVEGSVGRDARDRHRRLAIARGVRARSRRALQGVSMVDGNAHRAEHMILPGALQAGMRQSLARFGRLGASNHTPSLADFTTTTPEFKF
jgi:predicted NBD/HSP70 family sugar kinase